MSNVIVIYCFVLLFSAASSISTHSLVLIAAIDGFGFDYLDRNLTPTIQQLKQNGSSARYMNNAFPTVTYPNFFSISTGLHPETHGVIGNCAFNGQFKCLRSMDDIYELYHYNDHVTPLWTLNELSGENRYSATLGWPGSQFIYRNHTITYNDFNGRKNSTERINQAIRWFLDDEKPANLVFLYFHQLDEAGHIHGPDSEPVNKTLEKVDQLMEYLLQTLTKNGLADKMNIILLSDHGMLDLPRENIIDYREWLRKDSYEACGESPYWQIKYKPGFEQEVYENLTKAAKSLGTFTVYRKEEIPERWHVKNIERQADLLLLANPHYGFHDASKYRGDHGYDPESDERVRALFMANGPAFKSNYVVEPFSNLDIFPLVSKMLKLNEPPIKPNGTIIFIKDILKN